MAMSRRLECIRSILPNAPHRADHEEWDFMFEFGRLRDLLLYAPLFCPEFVEWKQSVFLRLNWMSRNLDATERMYASNADRAEIAMREGIGRQILSTVRSSI